jgi:hypothetical protein
MIRPLMGTLALAAAVIFTAAAGSEAANLGLCRNNVCNSSAYCTDTCTYDGAQTGTVTCESMNPGSCVRCWTAETKLDKRGETAKGSQLVAGAFTAWNVRRDFKCSNGLSVNINTVCQYDFKGPCAAAGLGVSGDVCCFFWFGHPCQGGC